MKPQQLKTFITVAECRSIRSAARALYVSQPAVTRTIRELELDLDVELVHRSVNGVELTQAGHAFYARANLLLEEMRRAREELSFLKAGGHGRVAAAVTTAVGLTVLPQALQAFTERMPQAHIRLTQDSGMAAHKKLQDGSLDFIVANTIPGGPTDEFSYLPLFEMALAVGVRAEHPCVNARTLRELQEQTWLVPSLDRDYHSRLFLSRGLELPSRILECESFDVAIHLMSRLDLVAIVTANQFDEQLGTRGIRALPLRENFAPVQVSVVTLRNSRLTPAAQCLVECLQASIHNG